MATVTKLTQALETPPDPGLAGVYDEPIYQRALDHVWIHSGQLCGIGRKAGDACL